MRDSATNTPITLDYANERLTAALKAQDSAEIEKWDFIIRSENEYRVKCKQRDRAAMCNFIRIIEKRFWKTAKPSQPNK